ncbi:MAG TPA: hypothetical protein PLO61_09500 [Fimbriimonadaceae bacterium]|nr:hypothetical protein [Fimbriimonadaceae bacterium]HRJ33864.1 hypothetical protein [Fimbriimonadaceae bacterium]
MVLRIEIGSFADEVKARLNHHEAYVAPLGRRTLATAASPERDLMIAAQAPLSLAETSRLLESQGMKVTHGTWLLESFELDDTPPALGFVAAIAYRTQENKPGVWMDAFPQEPNPAEVLRALYDEFRETGELPEVSYEEFLRLAHPNVAVISPDEITRFLERKL